MENIKAITNEYFKAMRDAKTEERNGYWMAYRAWEYSHYVNADCLVAHELLKENDIADFVQCLRESAIKEFALTDGWSGLIERLHAFAEAGCTIKSYTSVRQATTYHEYTDKALIMEIL